MAFFARSTPIRVILSMTFYMNASRLQQFSYGQTDKDGLHLYIRAYCSWYCRCGPL
jgi:hypothetical protein